MLNPGTGKDDAKFYAMAVVMTGYMAAEERGPYRKRALDRLLRAVEDEVRLRQGCRDTNLAAATRVRAW